MKSKRALSYLGMLAVAATLVANAQVKPATNGVPANKQYGIPSFFKMTIEGDKRIISCNGIPNHLVGAFPNPGNPNYIASMPYEFSMPAKPIRNSKATPIGNTTFGVAVNGVPFDPATAETFGGDRNYTYEGLTGLVGGGGGLGVDTNFAHVQPTGAYHYHGVPNGLVNKIVNKSSMTLLGRSADGFPIYYCIGFTDPNDMNSPVKYLSSSYRLKEGQRSGGPGGEFDGSFDSDFEYIAGSGDLDENNGRFGKTPEFPDGSYYYVITRDWPFIPRYFVGTPDASFRKGPAGQGFANMLVEHDHGRSQAHTH